MGVQAPAVGAMTVGRAAGALAFDKRAGQQLAESPEAADELAAPLQVGIWRCRKSSRSLVRSFDLVIPRRLQTPRNPHSRVRPQPVSAILYAASYRSAFNRPIRAFWIKGFVKGGRLSARPSGPQLDAGSSPGVVASGPARVLTKPVLRVLFAAHTSSHICPPRQLLQLSPRGLVRVFFARLGRPGAPEVRLIELRFDGVVHRVHGFLHSLRRDAFLGFVGRHHLPGNCLEDMPCLIP